MLIVLQLDFGVLPTVGTTHICRLGFTRMGTTYIAGVDRRQLTGLLCAVFRCVVGRPLRLICTSCFVLLFTRRLSRSVYWRAWLAPSMLCLFVYVEWT